jgi:thioredoxin-like negative regulator of GroEL
MNIQRKDQNNIAAQTGIAGVIIGVAAGAVISALSDPLKRKQVKQFTQDFLKKAENLHIQFSVKDANVGNKPEEIIDEVKSPSKLKKDKDLIA